MRPRLPGRLLREPLLHFLLLGGAIFGANRLLHPVETVDRHRIEIGRADVARMRALYAQQWGAPPSEADLPRLVDNYVRAEILYREGKALGLDAEDSVLRNRVVQKMEFLVQDSSTPAAPSDAELKAWYGAHADLYREPERIAFEQVYFSAALRGAAAEKDAAAALAKARTGGDPGPGDPLMVSGRADEPRSAAEIGEDYGEDFARALFALPGGGWEGPVRSSFGLHLVRIAARTAPRLPDFGEIRGRLAADYFAARQRDASDAAFARLKSSYRVEIAPDALAPQSAQR